ncbi:hypothetical protein TeGR_g14834 [Tetraparma gracilis]|uniref:Ribonuclease H1 N-terminal domain-containing protein n=1 Tax=Tetraparma gracilis TaxID=2962635 RepID=A0ABQ6M3G2_9STRA|nr:hypothetical protein TeGR_g14834 [Tetraparma gracilis]
MPRKAGKFYAVRCGHAPGVYPTWPECEAQIRGFRKAQHKSFRTRGEAEAFVRGEEPQAAEQPPKPKQPSSPEVFAEAAAIVNPDLPVPPPVVPAVPPTAPLLTLHFDGGARENGAVSKTAAATAGAGCVITYRPPGAFLATPVYKRSFFLGGASSVITNNYAEYMGLIMGLRQLCYLAGAGGGAQLKGGVLGPIRGSARVQVRGDSKLVLNQVQNLWQHDIPVCVVSPAEWAEFGVGEAAPAAADAPPPPPPDAETALGEIGDLASPSGAAGWAGQGGWGEGGGVEGFDVSELKWTDDGSVKSPGAPSPAAASLKLSLRNEGAGSGEKRKAQDPIEGVEGAGGGRGSGMGEDLIRLLSKKVPAPPTVVRQEML